MASEDYVRQQIERAAEKRFSSPQAEENVLLQMLKKRGAVEEALEALEPKDFTDLDNARLFRAMQEAEAKGLDIEAVNVDTLAGQLFPKHAEVLTKRLIDVMGYHDYGSGAYESIEDHIKILKALRKRRDAIAKVDELANGLRDPTKDVSELLSGIQDATEAADSDECKWVSLDDVNMATYEYLEKRQRGEIRSIQTGIASVDEIIGGLFRGEMTVVAARPSVGKSAFGLNVAMTAAKAGFKVGFVSCEMDDKGFGQRTLARGAYVDGDRLRKAQISPDDWDKLAYAMTDMTGMPVEFLFNNSTKGFVITVERVFKSVKALSRRNGIDLLIVDYIGIMRTSRIFKEERLRIAYISSELKRLAMTANIPVLALCQVNRMAQGRMPTMAELRDSGAVEQDADGILFLHRPESHEDKSVNPKDVAGFYAMQEGGSAYIAISVAKQRNGQTGVTQVMFDPGVMRYNEIMRE